MSTVTLVGTRLAEPGTEFVYEGEADGCAGCPYRSQCLNLSTGTRYRVTGVREKAQTLECAMHDGGVRAVEVEPVTIEANVTSKGAFAGSKTSLPGSCPYVECPSHEYCEPAGLEFDEEYRIRDILGDPPHEVCHLDRSLQLVELDADE
ncbi:hypothetical protein CHINAEXTREME_17810 [Halobiforma lacisalsi AJ5]|uniref:UPF0179 protein C445_14152 n=1 Tax=Natronobacterium lacisalsi AJ5 TaxID=358396 RepID=M0LDG7_NATLA|nr:UPF0179 family protein [Halobiforma lacisalsi]APW99508.1 hypothetical protein CHINAEXTREME_17810 [Halobiforma lacisalsi AJ5]EMA31631.1 hypothetical protein C445_14152 [Halobiforma lacisalsi AJ5]